MPVIDIEKFDPSLLSIGKSGRAFKLLYNKEPLQFCTSTMYSPFGVKSVNKEWSNFTEYYIYCSVNLSSTDSAVNFKNFLDKLNDSIGELSLTSVDTLKKPNDNVPDEVVYSPFYKENGSYPKLIKAQLSRDRNGNFDSFVFDHAKTKIKLSDSNICDILSKGKIFKSIIECSKIWYYNGKVGSMWNIIQLKLAALPTIQEEPENGGNTSVYETLMIEEDN